MKVQEINSATAYNELVGTQYEIGVYHNLQDAQCYIKCKDNMVWVLGNFADTPFIDIVEQKEEEKEESKSMVTEDFVLKAFSVIVNKEKFKEL